LYRAGVPGAAKPSIQATCKGAVEDFAGALEAELVPQLEKSMARDTAAIEINAGRFGVCLIM